MSADSQLQHPRAFRVPGRSSAGASAFKAATGGAAWGIGGYAVLLLISVLVLPLRLDEILQMLASAPHFSFQKMMSWIAQTPGAVPLGYFVQLPFVAIKHDSRLLARLPSVLFAVLSCIAFLRLCRSIRIQKPEIVLVAFMLVPLHFSAATLARPFELALFLSLTAAVIFTTLMREPRVQKAVGYGVLLTLCLFANPSSYLPAIGYLLFLFRFAASAEIRRVIWYVLPATAAPPVLFLIYYAWAQPQVSSSWLTAPGVSTYREPMYRLVGDVAGGALIFDAAHIAVAVLLTAGMLLGMWSTFRPRWRQAPDGTMLFCLFGGVLSVLGIESLVSQSYARAFDVSDALYAVPGAVILFVAGCEWLLRRSALRGIPKAIPVVAVLVLSVPVDIAAFTANSPDIAVEAAAITPELTSDSCVVFVSEGYSRALFSLFEPSLAQHECWNFFHRRIILAEHPFVRPDQKTDAESYFRGLNYVEKSERSVGGGQIITLEQQE